MSERNYGVELFHTEIFLPIMEIISHFDTEKKKTKAGLTFRVFREFFGRLHERFVKLMEIEDELSNFSEDEKNGKQKRPLRQIQMDFVDKTEAFHQQVYSTLSSFVKVLSVIAPHGFITKKHIDSNQNFISFVKESININYDILPLKIL